MVDVVLLIKSIIIFIALGIPGYVLGRNSQAITDKAQNAFSILLTDIAMPALVFENTIETDIKNLDPFCAAAAFAMPFMMTWLLWLISKSVFKPKGSPEARTAMVCSIFPNCGFLGIPLIKAAFPAMSSALIYISLFNISSTVCLLIFSGRILSENKTSSDYLKILKIPVLWAFIAGVAVSFIAFETVSAVLREYAGYFSQMTTALAMIVLGILLSKWHAVEKQVFSRLSIVVLMKLIVSPLIASAFLIAVKYTVAPDPWNMTSLAVALFIATGVSTAASAPALSQRYDSDGDGAAVYTIGTTVICAVTLPLISILLNMIFS